jgi:hypothetical protein
MLLRQTELTPRVIDCANGGEGEVGARFEPVHGHTASTVRQCM